MTNTDLNCAGSLISQFFSVNTCTIFCLWLRVHRCGGLMVCIDLHHLMWGTWASMDFGMCGGPGTNPPWYQGTAKFLTVYWSRINSINIECPWSLRFSAQNHFDRSLLKVHCDIHGTIQRCDNGKPSVPKHRTHFPLCFRSLIFVHEVFWATNIISNYLSFSHS